MKLYMTKFITMRKSSIMSDKRLNYLSSIGFEFENAKRSKTISFEGYVDFDNSGSPIFKSNELIKD